LSSSSGIASLSSPQSLAECATLAASQRGRAEAHSALQQTQFLLQNGGKIIAYHPAIRACQPTLPSQFIFCCRSEWARPTTFVNRWLLAGSLRHKPESLCFVLRIIKTGKIKSCHCEPF